MIVEDWRDAEPAVVETLFETEAARWDRALEWDSRASWAVVEAGRRRGHVSGWLLRASTGDVQGWTYYLLHDGELQIGGLTASRSSDYRLLLDRVLDSPEASRASWVSAFVFPAPPSLVSALSRRRFAVRRSLYMRKVLTPVPDEPVLPPGLRLRRFAARDTFPAARLMATAYDGVPGAACFAPHGRLDEWARYLRQLIDTPACGRWLPEASFVVEDPGSSRLTGAILVTRLSAVAAHVAQIAVAAEARGQRLGDALLTHASAAAVAGGHSCLTLMVDDENTAARTLYARHGFEERSAFVSARRRGQIRSAFTAGGQKAEAGSRPGATVVSR
ncbi:MAG: N-acetyltransferase [Vicinamibacterales bacterium]|nr:N-acetyltransferase [Vicinamibacterales bacterium]